MEAPETSTSTPSSIVPRKNLWSKIVGLGQPDALTAYTGWLVIVTGVLCLLTALNVVVLHSTDSTLYEQATSRDRGWISAIIDRTSLQFSVDPKTAISAKIQIRNIGSAAVQQVTYGFSVTKITRSDVNQPWESLKDWPEKIQKDVLNCTEFALPTILPVAIDPTAKEKMPELLKSKFPLQGDVWSDDKNQRNEKLKTTIFIHGCVVYRSIKVGRTEFCYYLWTDPNVDVDKWEIRECPGVGNKID